MFNSTQPFRFGFIKTLHYVSLVGLISLSQVLLAGPPDFPPPPDASVEWVGKDIENGGIKTSIRAFRSPKTIEKVVEFYRREWKRPVEKGKPGFMETIDAAPWYIISRVEDDYLLTVQVQVQNNDASRSWGYLSTAPLPSNNKNKPVELGISTPKMSGSHVLNEIKHNDPGKSANTVFISNVQTVSNNAAYYRNFYESKGWTKETDLDSPDSHALVYKTRTERVTIMMTKDKEFTRIVLNSVKNTIF
jgi:hypothetical protein